MSEMVTIEGSRRVMTKRQQRSMITAITKHKDAIAEHRDALRDILTDLEAVVDSVDDGVQSLGYAIDALSQYV